MFLVTINNLFYVTHHALSNPNRRGRGALTMVRSLSSLVNLRGLNCHIRTWGDPGGRPLLLLHGWMDNSASFQFLADALGPGWYLVAPDWRGFGLSQWAPGGVYAYTDYVADLDALIHHLGPSAPLQVLGHSLGGFVACMYAAARPARFTKLINVEGMGLRAREAQEAPAYLGEWLNELSATRMPKSYKNFEDLARRVLRDNAWLTEERALFVAQHWAAQTAPGGEVTLLSDPAHQRPLPNLFRLDEARALWGAVICPVLWVEGEDSRNTERHQITPDGLLERRGSLRTAELKRVAHAGHMVHMEQPEVLAQLVRDFIAPGG